MRNPVGPPTTRRTTPMEVAGPPEPFESRFARHVPRDGPRQLSRDALEAARATGSTEVTVTVVVGDRRLSWFVLKEAIRPVLFARFIIGFTEAVRGLTHANGGGLDELTGDGFISAWLHPAEYGRRVARIPGLCQEVLPTPETRVANLRANSSNFPIGVGLSLGADSGPCELARVGEALTLIGGPIVGATRMVAGLSANRLVANVLLGQALESDRAALEERGIRIRRTNVRTKEYPSGPEAFELAFPLRLRVASSSLRAHRERVGGYRDVHPTYERGLGGTGGEKVRSIERCSTSRKRNAGHQWHRGGRRARRSRDKGCFK